MSVQHSLNASSRLLLLLMGLTLMSACPASTTPDSPPAQPARPANDDTQPKPSALTSSAAIAPRRVILFIGDGMGLPAVTGAAYLKGRPLEMMKLPHVSFMRTHEHEFLTTDSAASATAFATGEKTHFEGVSVKPGTTQAQETDPEHHWTHMVAHAQRLGLRTGLVATSRINHATPAAFAAHRHHRSSYEEIALDMSRSGVDVLLGAGSQYFTSRKDGLNLFDAMREQGYAIATDAETLKAQANQAKRLVGLLHPKDMPSITEGGRAMSLAQLTAEAIKVLDRDNPNGYFLMVEGSQIDWEEHAMSGEPALRETLDMDEAVGVARAYAAERQDTLIVVTADHETGGLSILDPPSLERFVKVFGSVEAANAAAATTYPGAKAPVADALSTIKLGDAATFGPPEAPEAALVTSFGHLSVASRKAWTKDDSFLATHTNTMVPLFAQGAGAAKITTVEDNADLGRALVALLEQGVKAAPSASPPDTQPATQALTKPKNIILMIGDGMGLASVSAAFYAHGSLNMLQTPVKGFVSTHGADRVVNDSAATATALATGHRTRYGAVGMMIKDGKLSSTPTALERAEARGMRTGLVTTTTITHATPAAFYAHVEGRGAEDEIAQFMVNMPSRIKDSDGIDVAMGGGASIFSTAQLDELKARGVVIEQRWSADAIPAGTKLLGLYAPKQLDEATKRLKDAPASPTLAAMTQRALDALAPSEQGFFLMVEGGQIDWRLHDQRRDASLIDEVVDFDDAVGVALAYAKAHPDTLVIITADHDHSLSLLDNHYGFSKGHCQAAKRCGGDYPLTEIPLAKTPSARREGFSATALQGKSGAPALILQYAWIVQEATRRANKHLPGPHAAHFVPLMATGPGAAAFGGVQDQPRIGQLIHELLKP